MRKCKLRVKKEKENLFSKNHRKQLEHDQK